MRRKDEMEQKISNKSMKITWFVIVMALFVIGLMIWSSLCRQDKLRE